MDQFLAFLDEFVFIWPDCKHQYIKDVTFFDFLLGKMPSAMSSVKV